MPLQLNASVPAFRPQPLDCLVDQRRQRTRCPSPVPVAAQVEEALQVALQQRQLAQGHLQGGNTCGALWLEVWDSGPGPSPEIEERLFEPFVTGKPEGVGLGLAVSRQIVEGHGGRITWRRQNSRTCFRIELPAGERLPHDQHVGDSIN